MIWNRISRKFILENLLHMIGVSSFSKIVEKNVSFHYSELENDFAFITELFGNRIKM